MDIKEEREAFEAYMAEKYKNLMDRRQCLNNGGGYMAWDMNVAWQVWQAAKAQAVPEPVLDAPACVGAGTFQKGVKWSTVISAAQRHYKNDGHHERPAVSVADQLRIASGHSVVVPKEPTYEMLEAGSEARSRTEGHIASIWEAMIEAQEPAND